jgi:hypothetical protein
MEKNSESTVNSLRMVPRLRVRPTKLLGALLENATAGPFVSGDPKSSTSLPTDSNQSNRPQKTNAINTTFFNHNPPVNHDSDLQELRHELERLLNHTQSIKKENETLRRLLASQPIRPASTFRRAIVMRICPEAVKNAIGVHKGHDSIFVSLEATLFNFESLPIQKVSTSFSDGHWQEEMQFILDTESRWMEGRVGLQLKQKMFVSADDPIIATASISPHHFSHWLYEGGEHCVEIQMDRTSSVLEDECSCTMLFFSVRVGTERLSSHQSLNVKNTSTRASKQLDEKCSPVIERHVQSKEQVTFEVAALPGIPNESDLVSKERPETCRSDSVPLAILKADNVAVDHEKNRFNIRAVTGRESLSTHSAQSKNSALMKAVFPHATDSASSASITDEEEASTTDIKNVISNTELVPISNIYTSANTVKSNSTRQSLSLSPKIYLQAATYDPKECDKIKDSNSAAFDSEVKHASVRENLVFESLAASDTTIVSGMTTAELEDSKKQADVSADIEMDAGPNLVAAIKGISLANRRMLAIIQKNRQSKPKSTSDLAITPQKSDPSGRSSVLSQVVSEKSEHAVIEKVEYDKLNDTKGCCFYVGSFISFFDPLLGSSFTLGVTAIQMMMSKFFARFRRHKKLATVQPVDEVSDVESDTETLKASEQRRNDIEISKLQSKTFLEELEKDDQGSDLPSDIISDQVVYDATEAKLTLALSQLKDAFFNVPKRAVKLSPVTNIVEFMKNLPAGKSTSVQRLTAIQHFLQSKWIDCDSMLRIMIWIKSPSEEVKFFESTAMRVVDKQGLLMIARRFVHAHGTKFAALKTVERLLVVSGKDTHARELRRESHFRQDDEGTLPSNAADGDSSESNDL